MNLGQRRFGEVRPWFASKVLLVAVNRTLAMFYRSFKTHYRKREWAEGVMGRDA
jgi:hypothetical protein